MSAHDRGRRPVLRIVGFTAICAGTLSISHACQPWPWEREPLAPALTSRSQETSRCPIEDSIAIDTLNLVLPGSIAGIPEFHDCQRFIVHRYNAQGQWREYGALAAIWVRDSLDFVVYPVVTGGLIGGGCDSASYVVHGQPLCWAADSSYVIPDLNSPLGRSPGSPTNANAVPVALVWSDAKYEPFGIKPGFNCLYLYDPVAWKAKMVPMADQKSCRENIDPGKVDGRELAVRETRVPGRGNSDYPPVVRLEQGLSPTRRGFRYYVGIKCMAAWCEIGRPPFLTRGAYSGDRTREIKGWYDEQHLAVHTQNDRQWPTGLLATTFPDPELDALNKNAWPTGVWIPVARTWLRAEPAPIKGTAEVLQDELDMYRQKFNLEPGAYISDVNTVSFCAGDQQTCFKDQAASAPNCELSGQREYWARIVSVSGRTQYRCVTYTPHKEVGYRIPGVVRWRWLENDEKGWVSCPSGCCQVDPDQ